MKKKLLLVLMLIAAVVVMPRVSAEEAVRATVTDITNKDTLTSDAHTQELTPDENGNYTITYDNDSFKILEGTTGAEGNNEDRPADKAWIGFRVALPNSGAKKYEIMQDGKELVTKTEIPTDDKNVDVYYGFDATKLAAAAAEGKNLESLFVLKLYSEDENTLVATQTIKVVVVPKGITLKDKTEDNKEVWNEEEFKENAKVIVNVVAVKDGKVVELEEPLSLTIAYEAALSNEELDKIKSVITDADLVGLYTDDKLENELDPTTKLTENTTVYVAYKTKAAVVEEPAPNTVDNAVMYMALAGASLLAVGGIAVYFKKVNE